MHEYIHALYYYNIFYTLYKIMQVYRRESESQIIERNANRIIERRNQNEATEIS